MANTGLFKALIATIPPDSAECESPETKRRHRQWRQGVFVFLLTFSLALAYGLVTYATETNVDQKVAAAVTPITAQVQQTAAKLDAINAQMQATNKLLVAKLASDLEDKIIQTKTQMCKAKTEEGVRFFRDLLQDFIAKYRELTGDQSKRAPSCTETGQ